MASLLGDSWDDPRTIGLLSAASALMQAGGPSRLPVGLGQALGSAMGSGMQGYQGQQQFLTQQKAAKTEQAFKDLQLKQLTTQMQQQLALQEALRSALAGGSSMPGGAPNVNPVNSANIPEQGNSPQNNAPSFPAQPPMAGQGSGMPQGGGVSSVYNMLANNPGVVSNPAAWPMLKDLLGAVPKGKADNIMALDKNGNPTMVSVNDVGGMSQLPFAPAVKGETVNAGGNIRIVNPYNNKQIGGAIPVTATPKEAQDIAKSQWEMGTRPSQLDSQIAKTTADEAAKGGQTDINTFRTQAGNAGLTISMANDMLGKLNSGIYSSGGANLKTDVANFLDGIGLLPEGQREKLINTQVFNKNALQIPAQQLKAVFGARPGVTEFQAWLKANPNNQLDAGAIKDLLEQFTIPMAQSQIKDYLSATQYAQRNNGSLNGWLPTYAQEAMGGQGAPQAKTQAQTQDPQSFDMLPPANQYDGKRMAAPDGKTIYKSINGKWVKQ